MGRPLKKKFFGSPATGGLQLVLAHVWLEDSVAAETGYYIVRQVGTGRYQVTNGTKVGVVKLVDALPDAPGEGTIEITVFGSEIREYAKKIHNRTVVTFDGNTYKWSTTAASEEGQANLPFELFMSSEDEADSVEAIVGAANGAAIRTLILANEDEYLTSDYQIKFTAIETHGGGRQLAVGNGVAQWIDIFGAPATIQGIRDMIEFHTDIEYNKDGLIVAADSATSATKLDTALKQWLPLVYADRVKMINDLKASSVEAAQELGADLEVEAMTVAFRKLYEVFQTGADTKSIAQSMYAYRQAQSGKKFNGITKIIAAINGALA